MPVPEVVPDIVPVPEAVNIQRETCCDPGSNIPSTSKVESINIDQKSGNTDTVNDRLSPPGAYLSK